MNINRVCFIICYNDDIALNECMLYLNQLYVPEGYEVEVITVLEAASMAQGYNEAMKSSEAKYKIYMHQDVFILYRYFLEDLMRIFESDDKIGMVGMVGPKQIPEDGVIWHAKEYGNLYDKECRDVEFAGYRYSEQDGIIEAAAVDGFLIATAYDIPWREDIFDGWDFYDVSQSVEFRKRGYKIVVPLQKVPWCLHDDGGALTLWNYNKYRHIFLETYGKIREI